MKTKLLGWGILLIVCLLGAVGSALAQTVYYTNVKGLSKVSYDNGKTWQACALPSQTITFTMLDGRTTISHDYGKTWTYSSREVASSAGELNGSKRLVRYGHHAAGIHGFQPQWYHCGTR